MSLHANARAPAGYLGSTCEKMHMAFSPHQSICETYQSAWAIGAPAVEGQRLLRKSVAEDCLYQDQGIAGRGHAELTATIEDVNSDVPGATFRNDGFLTHEGKAVADSVMCDCAGF